MKLIRLGILVTFSLTIVSDASATCPASPQACLGGFARGSVKIVETKPGKEKLKISLQRGPALAAADLGQPIEQITDFDLGNDPQSLNDVLASDSLGNLYRPFGDTVVQTTPLGVSTEIIDATGDGLGNTLDNPVAIAVDGADNVYVAGRGSHNAFQVTPLGVVTEIIDATGDGGGNTLSSPQQIAVTSAGDVYVAPRVGNIFHITPLGVIAFLSHTSGLPIGTIEALDVDSVGNVIAAGLDEVIRWAPPAAPSIIIGPAGDGAGNLLSVPFGLAIDPSDNVFVGDEGIGNVFRVAPGGAISLVLGPDGNGHGTGLIEARGLDTDAQGNLFVTGFDFHSSGGSPVYENRVYRVSPAGKISVWMEQDGNGTVPNRAIQDVEAAVDGTVYTIYGTQTENLYALDPLPREICLYDDVGTLIADLSVTCVRPDCYKPIGIGGYKYKDKFASESGISSMQVVGGVAGKSRVKVVAKNNAAKGQTDLPVGLATALLGATALTVQVDAEGMPSCLSQTFTDIRQQTSEKFLAKP
ncbi:MAG: hypothetical protein P8R42_08340 [Candidatus Binatia bacterium]|nr:hypothetical protein [Candidatus Binatia bacterium]